MASEDAVLAANRAFYDAFEAQDLNALSGIWEQSDRAVCTHPGWATLHGWEDIRKSFAMIFDGSEGLQFIATNERVQVLGNTAWVTLDENLLGGGLTGTVAAMNVFVRRSSRSRWYLVAHHGSPITTTFVEP